MRFVRASLAAIAVGVTAALIVSCGGLFGADFVVNDLASDASFATSSSAPSDGAASETGSPLGANDASDGASTGEACSAQSCPDGCCDVLGKCQIGAAPSACGKGGARCASCTAPPGLGAFCSEQVCATGCAAGSLPGPTGCRQAQGEVLAAGGNGTCAVQVDGKLACWNLSGTTLGGSSTSTFTAVTAGSSHMCAITRGGETQCWGDNSEGQAATPAAVRFVQLAAGGNASCGLSAAGEVTCWGNLASPTRNGMPTAAISVGVGFGCGIRTNGRGYCWGTFTGAIPGNNVRAISAGAGQVCVVDLSDHVSCISAQGGAASPQMGSFSEVSTGGNFACGIESGDDISCWGSVTARHSNGPGFVGVSSGSSHMCAVRRNGSVLCWGADGSSLPVPQGIKLF